MAGEVIFPFGDKNGDRAGYSFWCEGCEGYHGVHVYSKNEKTGAQWKFNENLIKPTFTPSLHIKFDDVVCHSFVRNGEIQYLNDCTHKLKGKTVPLIPDRD